MLEELQLPSSFSNSDGHYILSFNIILYFTTWTCFNCKWDPIIRPSNAVAVRNSNVLILSYLLLVTICNWPDDGRQTETSCTVIQ